MSSIVALVDVAENPRADGQHQRVRRRAELGIDAVDLEPAGAAEHRAVSADLALDGPRRSERGARVAGGRR